MARRRRRRSKRRTSTTPEQLARDRFGVARLRPEQKRALDAVLRGRDALVVLPTGFGKSLVYQLPTLLLPGPVVVVSPLIALMSDQEQQLRRRDVPVVRLDSTLRAAERREAIARVRRGGALLVLTTPETLQNEEAAAALREGRPALLAVDEAHCVSEWGHDFRPAYLRIANARDALDIPTTVALTATATPRVREDVIERLALREPVQVTAPPNRPNLRLSAQTVPGDAKYDALARALRRLQRPGIVYCATTRAVDGVYGALSRTRIPVERYHGRMTRQERETAQRRYMRSGRRAVMVATNAFGMGIDKPDIRYVAHFQAPGSLEQYVQEAGRAGRDGKPADCLLLFDPADLEIQRRLQRSGRPRPAELRAVTAALQAWSGEERPVGLRDLATSAGARQSATQVLLGELVEAGLVERSGSRTYRLSGPQEELRAQADALIGRYEVQALEDEERLAAIEAYVESESCRSVSIRRWFGEADPPRCGRCDHCRAAQAERADRGKAGRAARGAAKAGPRARAQAPAHKGQGADPA